MFAQNLWHELKYSHTFACTTVTLVGPETRVYPLLPILDEIKSTAALWAPVDRERLEILYYLAPNLPQLILLGDRGNVCEQMPRVALAEIDVTIFNRKSNSLTTMPWMQCRSFWQHIVSQWNDWYQKKINNTGKIHNKAQHNKPEQISVQNTTSYHDLVASYDTQSGNKLGLFNQSQAPHRAICQNIQIVLQGVDWHDHH